MVACSRWPECGCGTQYGPHTCEGSAQERAFVRTPGVVIATDQCLIKHEPAPSQGEQGASGPTSQPGCQGTRGPLCYGAVGVPSNESERLVPRFEHRTPADAALRTQGLTFADQLLDVIRLEQPVTVLAEIAANMRVAFGPMVYAAETESLADEGWREIGLMFADMIEKAYGDLPTDRAPGPPTLIVHDMRAVFSRAPSRPDALRMFNEMFAEVGKFQIGQRVSKTTGDYSFEGEVRMVGSKRSGAIRYVAEDDRGVLMIFNERQLEQVETENDDPQQAGRNQR
jgi:hypothetical protein